MVSENVIGKWRMLLKFNDVGGLEFGTPPRARVTITRIREKFEVSRSHIESEMDRTKGKCYRVSPPRSPDLTPPDFYLWGTLKNTVYATKTQTLEELRDQIEHAIHDISLATIQTVCRFIRRRCWECTVAEGGYFEHVRA